MDAGERGKKPLMMIGGVIVINLLLSILIPSIMLTISSEMISALCLSGILAALLITIHPILVLLATVAIFRERSIGPTRTTISGVLMIVSLVIIPMTMGYGTVLSPLLLFTAMGVYLHGRLREDRRYLLYVGIGLLLLFYFGAFTLVVLEDLFTREQAMGTGAMLFSLPIATCILYLDSIYLILKRPGPSRIKTPSEERKEPSILMPPPGWMGDGLPATGPAATPERPPGWG